MSHFTHNGRRMSRAQLESLLFTIVQTTINSLKKLHENNSQVLDSVMRVENLTYSQVFEIVDKSISTNCDLEWLVKEVNEMITIANLLDLNDLVMRWILDRIRDRQQACVDEKSEIECWRINNEENNKRFLVQDFVIITSSWTGFYDCLIGVLKNGNIIRAKNNPISTDESIRIEA